MSKFQPEKITKEELEELNNLKNKIDLTPKEKKRLVVLKRLLDESQEKVETVSTRLMNDLSSTQNDHYRDGGKNVFKTGENVGENCKYEYNTEVQIAESGKDKDFERRVFMKKIIKDTKHRCDSLESLLQKRELTVEEQKELKELEKKKKLHRADYDEECRYEALYSKQISSDGEKMLFEFAKGTEKCFYYKEAHRLLKPGVACKEWNGDISKSKEASDIIETCSNNPHALIGVVIHDPIDYAKKCQSDKYKLNSVIVIDSNRMGPGGSWERGDEGVEEQAFLRSSLSLAIDKEISDHFYPMRNESLLYIPKTMVFRNNRATDYKMIDKSSLPDIHSFIMCSGAIVKQAEISGDEVKEHADNERITQEVYMEKIKNCMATAAFHGHNSIIFTPLGCYNYKKDFTECADAFLYAIFDPATKYYRRFRSIVICVPPDIIPLQERIHEELENGMLRRKKQINDLNKELYETLKVKLHQIRNEDIIFSDINLNPRAPQRKLLDGAFSSLKLDK